MAKGRQAKPQDKEPETSVIEQSVRIITVFVSSPSDTSAERAVLEEVCKSINDTDGQTGGFRLELFRWEHDVAPKVGPGPQPVVDEQTPIYNIYLGIMATRFGTPTGRYGSGTEKEFRDALESWKEAGSPWIMFYFDASPKLTGDPEQAKQFVRVCRFRAELEKQGILATYSEVRGSAAGFFEQVSIHLRQIAQRLLQQQEPEPGRKRKKTWRSKPIIPPAYISWLLG